jgi:hypothetical protein
VERQQLCWVAVGAAVAVVALPPFPGKGELHLPAATHRYDAARTVEALATRLRDQLDLDALSGELLAVVDQTVAPSPASLWLRPGR